MKKALLAANLFFVALVISGCSNPYSKFYTDSTGGVNNHRGIHDIIPTGKPKLLVGTDIESDNRRMLEDNYCLIGYSSFNAGEVNQNLALKQAAKIHADTVIAYSTYTNTVSGIMPMTVPNTQTSYHSGTVYGSGGGYANYSGTSTTYGSTTTYMPYSVNRYEYYASFWVKPAWLGILVDDLTDELRRKAETDNGVYIISVVKNTPAFNSGLLSGDVIRRANGIEIISMFHFLGWLKETNPSAIEFEIFRNGKTITKQIQLN